MSWLEIYALKLVFAELVPLTVHIIGTNASSVHLNTADCRVVILGEGVTEYWRPL